VFVAPGPVRAGAAVRAWFEVANHRSILEPVELSMIAVDEDRPAARKFDLIAERVLAVAGIYGPNASGKSNVVEALTWLSTAVDQSLRAWDKIIPREPFKFRRGPDTPSRYEVEMIIDGIRYAYHVELDDSSVLSEGLYSYPERRQAPAGRRPKVELPGKSMIKRLRLYPLDLVRRPRRVSMRPSSTWRIPSPIQHGYSWIGLGTAQEVANLRGRRSRTTRCDAGGVMGRFPKLLWLVLLRLNVEVSLVSEV
jgi:AAA domain, putative AbiEii toxin, Type IV TA system